MAVAVDQTRHNQVARSVKDPLRPRSRGEVGHCANLDNGPIGHGKIGRLLQVSVCRMRQEGGIGYEQVMVRHGGKALAMVTVVRGKVSRMLGGQKGHRKRRWPEETGYGIR